MDCCSLGGIMNKTTKQQFDEMFFDCDLDDIPEVLKPEYNQHFSKAEMSDELLIKYGYYGGEQKDTKISIEETLKQRGEAYGEFSHNLDCVSRIVDAMKECRDRRFSYRSDIESKLDAEFHYLAIKLARIAANPEHTDSYHDLAGYATLMERERSHIVKDG